MVWCLSFVACVLLFVACCWLFVDWCLLLGAFAGVRGSAFARWPFCGLVVGVRCSMFLFSWLLVVRCFLHVV